MRRNNPPSERKSHPHLALPSTPHHPSNDQNISISVATSFVTSASSYRVYSARTSAATSGIFTFSFTHRDPLILLWPKFNHPLPLWTTYVNHPGSADTLRTRLARKPPKTNSTAATRSSTTRSSSYPDDRPRSLIFFVTSAADRAARGTWPSVPPKGWR